MSRLKRIILTVVPILVFVGAYFYDLIQQTVRFDDGEWHLVRDLLVVGSFFLLFLLAQDRRRSRSRAVPKEMGRLLIVGVVLVFLSGVVTLIAASLQESRDAVQVPHAAILGFLSFAVGVPLGIFSMSTLLTVNDLVLHKRRKGTKRNLGIYHVLLLLVSLLTLPAFLGSGTLIGTLLLALAIIMVVVNSFKQNWIVSLSRREKVYSIVYSALLFLVFVFLTVLVENQFPQRALQNVTPPLQRFVLLNCVFGAVYFGMAFISTLFHLPTAEVYERKQSELSSLHNLSRLVSQVFDFQDLVQSVTQMTLEVCGATGAWLELIKHRENGDGVSVEIVAKKNLTSEQIAAITGDGGTSLRDIIIESNKHLLIDDVGADKRTKHIKKSGVKVASMLSVPLFSHGTIIGILHAAKDIEYGFDHDDVDVLTTFADNVTIAIENSRLIEESLRRERYQQEIMVAQEMQKRLIPQQLPQYASLQLSACWEPSLEVGGDYYDYIHLDDRRLGIVVGDVSGKGVSAAFYMAEVKGIFQSLSKLCSSPKELLVRANETLMGSLERKAFISLLYAILDTEHGTLHLARAGHCPMAYLTDGTKEYVRPNGIGLGMTNGEVFRQSTEERSITLKSGDVCIFYTDGVTESRNAEGEEYGYERLLSVAETHRHASAREIQDNILADVKRHTGTLSFGDDMTLVIVKWMGMKAA
jgi:sigma-B regulation protein RsbU (phosphoserine phosphatase)